MPIMANKVLERIVSLDEDKMVKHVPYHGYNRQIKSKQFKWLYSNSY